MNMNVDVYYVNFTYVSFEIKLEDEFLTDMLCDAFKMTGNTLNPNIHSITVISDKGELVISLDGTHYCICENRENAVFKIAEIFGQFICSEAGSDIFIMHAAGVMISGKLVTIAGVSGSGKTTLSLLMSRYGKYVGDEYAYFNSKTAEIWHEEHPVQIKAHNDTIIKSGRYNFVSGYSCEIGGVFYIPLDGIDHIAVSRDSAVIPSYIVFPHYDKEYTGTTIRQVDIRQFPDLILKSLMGKYPPALVLKQFIFAVARENVNFLEIDFSDGREAAVTLSRYVKERTKNEI